MRIYLEALRIAIENNQVNAALNALVAIAEQLIEQNDTERAADILALAMCYPMSQPTHEAAEILFDDLESRLCPRVIWDARARAAEITLDDLAVEVLGQLAEE